MQNLKYADPVNEVIYNYGYGPNATLYKCPLDAGSTLDSAYGDCIDAYGD